MSPARGQMFHIHPGDCSADGLRQHGVGGRVEVWCDVLFRGPLRAERTPEARRERAESLSVGTGGALSVERCEEWRKTQDEALLAYRDYAETVLWFDACLYDQTILVNLLDWFASQDLTSQRLSLICLGEHPAFERFCGLGELTPEQLAELLPGRIPVTRAMLELGQRAWQALCAATPLAVEALSAEDTGSLRYLGEALVRYLEEFPGVGDGLSRLERQCLHVLADGPANAVDIFCAASAAEDHPFFGDTMLWETLNQLARATTPLLTIEGPEPLLPQWDCEEPGRWQLAITSAGERVLAGEVDAVALNGIDRWQGGTHLVPGNVWRWDRAARRMVAPA